MTLSLVSRHDSDERTAKFFFRALRQVDRPPFSSPIDDQDLLHKAGILAEYARVPSVRVDRAATLIASNYRLRHQVEDLPDHVVHAMTGSICLVLTGYFGMGIKALGYSKPHQLTLLGSKSFQDAAASETDPLLRRVLYLSGIEFINWQLYLAELHRAILEHRIVPEELLLPDPSLKPS